MDLGKTTTKFQDWWNHYSDIYNWERTKTGHWEIDFESCEIFLIES